VKKALFLAALTLTLAACGSRTDLRPKEGRALPVKPATASVTPTPDQLMTADTQSRPKRSDEQLRRSEQRREDKFDLPPT
jgi:hypothetical protein